MKKWIAAILHHCTAFDNLDKRHMYCPTGEDTWCKYKQNGREKQKVNLPVWMFDILSPVFQDLMCDDLLQNLCAWADPK